MAARGIAARYHRDFMVSTLRTRREALFYPFHLCRNDTLGRLLAEYDVVHFRDYMALQLTPMSGTTAYADRMGQFHEALVREDRIVQGYSVSGPLDPELAESVDRDLADMQWRACFHSALQSDRFFQRGLFDFSHGVRKGQTRVPGPAALLELSLASRSEMPYSTALVRKLSERRTLAASYDFEYGLGLVKTSAALRYTVRLCHQHRLEAVTDSLRHFRLLARTCEREGLPLAHHCVTAQPEPGSTQGP
jgi:hypothetical protein